MSRRFLLGAVFGSAATSIAAVTTYFLVAANLTLDDSTVALDDSTSSVLVFYNYADEAAEMIGSDPSRDSIALNRTAKILHDCGAWYFETESQGQALSYNALFPLISQNSESLGCVLRATGEAEIPMRIESRRKLDLEELLISANAPPPN